jgi:hypothetical protein
VELVAVRLHLLEETLDAAEAVGAGVDPLTIGGRQVAVGHRHVDPPLLGGLEELLLVPAPGGVGPRLHRAVGKAPRGVGDDEALVVAEDVAEALALRAGAERVVEGEEEGLRPREGRLAARAAELAAHRYHRAPGDVDLGASLALGERRLERLGDAPPRLAAEDHPVEDDEDGLAGGRLGEIGGPARRVSELVEGAPQLHAREPPPQERGVDRAGIGAGRGRQREADEGAGVGMVAKERLRHALRRVAASLLPALWAVDAPDPPEEETEVVIELGRGAHGGAGGADGILLFQRDGRPHVLDAVHVGAIHPLEEHARVRRE